MKQQITESDMPLILNELQAYKGSPYELLKDDNASALAKNWVNAWGPFCEYSQNLEEYYPLPLNNL